MNEQEFRERRRHGIGASDAGPICGVGFVDAETLFLQKLGLEESVTTPRMRMGIELEPIVAKLYSEATGVELLPGKPFATSKTHSWQFANVDRVRPDGRLVELKCLSGGFGDAWGDPMTDEVPEGYLLQVQHQMGVLEATTADLAALSVPNWEIRVYRFEFNPKLFADLTAVEAEFWEKVQKRDFGSFKSKRAEAVALAIQRVRPGWRLDLPQEEAYQLAELVSDWEEAKILRKKWEEQADESRAEILRCLGDYEAVRLPDGRLLKQKVVHIHEHTRTVEAYTRTDLRIVKGKVGA